MNTLDLIAGASLTELKAGYIETGERYTCLCCGQEFAKGIIYPLDGVLYEAWRYTRQHIEQEHQSVFACLVGLDKSMTGISDLQRRLLTLFYQGKSDADVQKELGIGAASTIRNHRFLLRERERQARLFLAIMELLRERDGAGAGAGAEAGAGAGRGRGAVAATEAAPHARSPEQKALRKYFPAGPEGPLKSLSIPEKHRRLILGEVARRFESGRTYPEAEINQVLEAVWADYVTLRRALVDYGFLSRMVDGSQYWRSDVADERKGGTMDRKKELKQMARETQIEAGVFQVRNTRNGKIFVESTRNLKTINGQRFQLETGAHPNKALQRECSEFGPDAFVFEVLEVLEKPETGPFDEKEALKKLKAQWLERLQPYGERGYNPVKERP